MSPSVEPFDEAKYKALMDGLECSEILKSSIIVDNEKYRLDSDFFQKKYLIAYEKIKKINHSTIRDELDTLTDFHANGSYESIAAVFKLLDAPDYAYMVRTVDLERKDYINGVKYISKDAYEFLEKSRIYGGEVIINKIGSPGMTYLMPKLNRPVSLGMNQFLIRMKKDGKIDNTLLFIFLNTEIGKLLIERKINGTVPLSIDKEAVRSIYVPVFSSKFINVISMIVAQSEKSINQALELYSYASKKLLEDIDFDLKQLCTKGINERNLSDSFRVSGRLDAEYYQPKYDALFESLKKIRTKKLGGIDGIVTMIKSIEPGSDAYVEEGIPFVRVSDMSKFEITDPEIKLDPKVIPSPEKLFPEKDTILFSKDGSVGIAYKVDADMEVITSGALLHLTVRDTSEVLPDYLTLVLNSPVVQLQAERDSNGAIIQHWKPSEIENVVIPILDMEIQKEITAKIQESFALRCKSKQLLDYAKQAVEMAIEHGEEMALIWLNEKTETKEKEMKDNA